MDAPLGKVPRERIDPNGGSVAPTRSAPPARALGHAAKQLAATPTGSRAIVSI